MASRVTLKAVNDELARRGFSARLEKASGYSYFSGGETDDWLDRSVKVTKISDLTLTGWIDECHKLEKVNRQIMATAKTKRAAANRNPTGLPAPLRNSGWIFIQGNANVA